MKRKLFRTLIRVMVIPFLSLLAVSCTKNFKDTNTNPNLIQTITPGSLLNESIYGLVIGDAQTYLGQAGLTSGGGGVTSRLMQVQITYPDVAFGTSTSRYQISGTTGGSIWVTNYQWAKDLNQMLNISRAQNASNYVAIALTLRAWVFSNLTDCFGSISFSEASKGDSGIFQPAFDGQEAIYKKILSDLEEANTLYSGSDGMKFGNDILFHNDITRWRKFTNSLRLRLLLRASNVMPSAIPEMVEMINNPNEFPIIDNLQAQAVLNITGAAPNITPWPRPLDIQSNIPACSFFVDQLNELNDPRRSVILTEALDLSNQPIGYKGIPVGWNVDTFNYTPSLINTGIVIAPMIIPILTYAEVEFIKAELAQKGYLPNAQKYYEQGVNAAVETWTGQGVPANYFNNPYAAYDGSLNKIMVQKYLALFLTDFQQWAEYRRTGLPQLGTPIGPMENNGVMPSRLMYPTNEIIVNPKNYKEAVDSMGGTDNINAKMWWQK